MLEYLVCFQLPQKAGNILDMTHLYIIYVSQLGFPVEQRTGRIFRDTVQKQYKKTVYYYCVFLCVFVCVFLCVFFRFFFFFFSGQLV